MGVAVIFPGQGSQVAGMGRAWSDHPAWSVVTRAEEVLGERLAPLLLDEDPARLSRTRDAQLGVLLCSLVAWEASRPVLDAPVGFAGHSLGQLTALMASGALGFEDGLRLAARRAELTDAAARRRPGRMAALLGAEVSQAEAACRSAGQGCWLANDNAPGQVVVAGSPDRVDAALEAARNLGVRRAANLTVDGAFHTPLMAEAAREVGVHAGRLRFDPPDAPVVANTDAAPHLDAGGWAARLSEHLVSRVRWRESQLALAGLGARELVEIGPGRTLSALARRSVPDLSSRSVGSPEDLASLAASR
ncbi:MAG: ACP S-malonyltransferase [Acidimicrobiales bacterium]